MSVPSVESIFQTKYDEFSQNLKEVFPELAVQITAAQGLTKDARWTGYRTEVLKTGGRPDRPAAECPGPVLPGVVITSDLWTGLTETTKTAINQFLNLMTFSFVMKEGEGATDMSGTFFKDFAEKFMGDWRNKMNRTDFDSFTKRLTEMFGTDGSRLPPFPERLKHGKLVKLAEEIVRELKPEEFGLDPEMLKKCEADPSAAFELLMGSTFQNPEKLQGAMKRIVKRLQEKFQRGEFNPQELVAEAEEMMKEFADNPAFVELMEVMRSTFGFEDMGAARASGNDGSGRLAMARARLRKKLDAKQKTKK